MVYSDDFGSGSSSGCSVLSHTFLIRDSLARGFHRWFSITVLTRDRLMLLNMWPFLEKTISAIVSDLQIAANKVGVIFLFFLCFLHSLHGLFSLFPSFSLPT